MGGQFVARSQELNQDLKQIHHTLSLLYSVHLFFLEIFLLLFRESEYHCCESATSTGFLLHTLHQESNWQYFSAQDDTQSTGLHWPGLCIYFYFPLSLPVDQSEGRQSSVGVMIL